MRSLLRSVVFAVVVYGPFAPASSALANEQSGKNGGRFPPPLVGYAVETESRHKGGAVLYRKLVKQSPQPQPSPRQPTSGSPRGSGEPNRVIHVTYVDFSNGQVSLSLSPPSEKGQTPTRIARKSQSTFSINASFFTESHQPLGLTISGGEVWPGTRDTASYTYLSCNAAATQCALERQVKAPQKASTPKVDFAVSGRPALVRAGVPRKASRDESCPSFCQKPHPRVGMGLHPSGSMLIFALAEGRRFPVQGLGLSEFAQVMKQLGAHEAVNLDGGGSAALILEGKRVNALPFNEISERAVANVIHIH